jgi:2-dehydro-3-deoxyphosphogalactonate aldolase
MTSQLTNREPKLVAILRGVLPQNVVAIGDILYEAGIRKIEVPLNSPDPFASITALAKRSLPGLTVGAGTVLDIDQVRRTHEAGGRLMVSPNSHGPVIEHAVELGMEVMPGFATATEAFAAIAAGAKKIKLFPAVTYGTKHLQALRAVLPPDVEVYPVGGISAQDIPAWLAAGATGFGFGSELFKPDYSLEDIDKRAKTMVSALRDAGG